MGAARDSDPIEGWSAASSAALFAFALGVAFLRNPAALLLPPMAFEDGAVLFQHYYPGVGFADLFVFYAGYVSVVPDLLGFLACRLPTPWIPLGLGLFPLLLTAAVPVETARVLGAFGVSRPRALALGAAMAALPLGSAAIESSTVYAYCHLLYLVALWSLAHLRAGAATERFWWWLAPLGMASHPLSVAIVPVYALGLWLQRSREAAFRLGYVAAIAATYLAFGIESETRADFELEMLGAALSTWLGRIWFEVFFGGVVRAQLWGAAPWAVWVVAAGFAVGSAVLLAREAHNSTGRTVDASTASVVALGYTALLTAMVVIARWGSPAASLDEFVHGRRYLHVQQLLLVVVVGWGLARAFGGRPFPRAWGVAIGIWIIALNASDAFYFETPREDGLAMQSYLAELERLEASGAGGSLRLGRGEWSIEVDAR